MPTPVSSANTTSADQVLLSPRPRVEGDCIPDEVMDEVTRRIIAEVDSTARAAGDDSTTGSPQAVSGSVAVGAEEVSFGWTEPFRNVSYGMSLFPLNDPGAPLRVWLKSKTTTKAVFGVVGHTSAVNFSFVATP